MDTDIAWEECIPDLPLDTANLPPLNALSTSSSDDLPQLELLDLFSFDNNNSSSDTIASLDNPPQKPSFENPVQDTLYSSLDLDTISNEKLSHCTSVLSQENSPAPSTRPSSPPTDTSATTAEHSESKPNKKFTLQPNEQSSAPKEESQSELVLELSTRLSSAGAEASALRKRVASLAAENRGLRHALDHANARLVAVAQAAAAHPPQNSPVMLGLAQVPSDVAQRLGSVLTVSSETTEDPRDRKKRKRMTGAATTMACVMFMWGAFVGTPGLLKGSGSYRSDGNLPAVWTSSATDTAVAPVLPRHNLVDSSRGSWQPNCMRVLEQLPHGKEGKEEAKVEPMLTTEAPEVEKDATNKMFVDMGDEKAANVVARADDTETVLPDYSYVLCRDAANAIDNIKACRGRLQRGEPCGQPHTISLILPARAAGIEDDINDTQSGSMQLAEVQCSILSVARIPSNAATVPKSPSQKYGKVIATVPEGNADVRQAESS